MELTGDADRSGLFCHVKTCQEIGDDVYLVKTVFVEQRLVLGSDD